MKELLKEQERLAEELEILKIQVQKKTQDTEAVAEKIIELKEQLDFGSFKFVHANIPEIMKALAPKHKTPLPRDIHVSSGNDSTPLIASIPWSDEVCSDENPCNANVCPRCTIIHFKNVIDRLLAGYYSK